MSHLRKIIGLFLGATLFFYTTQLLAESLQKTETIKIISASCVDNDWNFRIYDASSDKEMSLKLGVENAYGFKIESFDEKKCRAVLKFSNKSYLIELRELALSRENENQSEIKFTESDLERVREVLTNPKYAPNFRILNLIK